MSKFPKDAWIKDMLVRGYLVAREDGSVYRARSVNKDTWTVNKSAGYRVVKQQIHKKSGRVYFNVTWRGVTKSVLTNRVVAWRFHPNPDDLPQVNHKNGDKENNAKDNLEWATGSENEKHAQRTGLKSGRGSANSNAKLTVSDVHEIRAYDGPVSDLVQRFGVSRSTIVNIQKRKTWQHV